MDNNEEKKVKPFKNGKEKSKRRFWFYFSNALVWSLVAFLAIIGILQFADKKSGYRTLNTHTAVVVSESMSRVHPNNLYYLSPDVDHIQIGDIIKAKGYKSYDQIQLNDVVIYTGEDGTLICHRVVDKYIDPIKGECVVTRGDANAVDDTPIVYDTVRGKVVKVTPKLGKVIMFMQTPYFLVAIFGSGFSILAGMLIAGLWKDKKNKNDDGSSKNEKEEKSAEKSEENAGNSDKTVAIKSILIPLLVSTIGLGAVGSYGVASSLFTKSYNDVSFKIGTATPTPVYKRIYIETKYFFNSGANNESVNAYCWSSSVDRNNGWPGLATTWVEDLADSKKIFYFDVDTSLYDRVLFTKLVNGSFSLKTVDIQMSSFESNNTVYLNADSWSDPDTGIPVGFYNRS